MALITGPDHLTGTQRHGRLRGGHCTDELLGYSLADGPRDDDRSRSDMGWTFGLCSIGFWLLAHLLRALWDLIFYGPHTPTQWPSPPRRRHLDESQRAMVATRIANLPQGVHVHRSDADTLIAASVASRSRPSGSTSAEGPSNGSHRA